jgi:mannose-6-phosphate isomerase-like protein (cupin superfamily)
MAGMRLKKSGNTRLVEGGRYNVNLRWNGTPSVEVHDKTIDTWYVLAGGATVNTGYQVKDGARVPGTGVSAPAKPGDVFFHPSNFYHGFSEVAPDIFWLNIRWDGSYRRNNRRAGLQAAGAAEARALRMRASL